MSPAVNWTIGSSEGWRWVSRRWIVALMSRAMWPQVGAKASLGVVNRVCFRGKTRGFGVARGAARPQKATELVGT
jgi:hypothetical protein